ncbi:hypothetical protein SCOR_08535 [Sulfidibacter corallicola]|uniref:N-methyl-D-aspartate receptor NMDAR2C subunit n=1 Tax=Sulfidibacter corallicola TaxID=2818388 RepID=A0A8A4TXF1_SULCO|nr:hypothetical protein [Sulfidibacter corallicola]QTD51195.1 hypothetical protein J3U87_01890 [Sulfidibacter corallicola]
MSSQPEALIERLAPRWADLWQSLTHDPGRDLFEALVKAYTEPHRAYHDLSHVSACLTALDEARDLAQDPKQVEIAIWFHDAIYRTTGSDNELKSARWAASELIRSGVARGFAERVSELIQATVHRAQVEDDDARLLVDIDLGILGQPPEIYDRYERDIRQEYRLVPGFLFRCKRAEILEGFLARPRIYNTDFFFQRWEKPARDNLTRAIAALRGRAPESPRTGADRS